MSVTGKSEPFKVDTSGLDDRINAVQDAAKKMQGYVDNLFEIEIEKAEDYNATHEKVLNAFNEIPEDEEPLEENNFNIIMNSFIDDDKKITTEVTNYIQSLILTELNYPEGTKLSELTEGDANLFLDMFTKFMSIMNGEDNELSLEELQGFLNQAGFEGVVFEETEKDEKNE